MKKVTKINTTFEENNSDSFLGSKSSNPSTMSSNGTFISNELTSDTLFDGLDLEKLRYAFGALSDCDDSSNLSKPSTWRNRATHRLDNEQSHSIDGDGNSGTEVKKKRGRKPNPFRTRNKSLFSRILKTDIRRDYAIMFNNAVNSHDPTLLMRYLRKFAHPDMQVVGDLPDNGNIVMSRLAQLQSLFDQQLPPPPNMDMSFLPPTGLDVRLANNKFVVQGLPSSSFFLLSVQQDTPDSVGIVQDVVIKRTLFEEGSVIHATIHVRGTRLFALQDGQMTPYTSPSPFLDRPPADDSSSGVKIITMEMRFKVTCRVALDSNFFITKLQHEAYPLSPPLMPSGMPL